MLNKPKFMSPSVNMHGNTVIDLNSETLPFSCIVDGNETVTDFRIIVSRLKDNIVVFDTGMVELPKPFFPINNRNQNVMFGINLRDYFTKVSIDGEDVYIPYLLNTNSTYNSDRTYYEYKDGQYTKYTRTSDSDWNAKYATLYTLDFVNSTDAFYWSIVFKNRNSNTTVYSASEVFYANSTPETTMYYSYDNEFFIYDAKLEKYVINEDLALSLDKDKPSVLKKRKIFLKSTYAQAENIALKRYGWRITDITNNKVVIDTISQNQIYGIADDISCKCNGLMNQTSYLAELYIETQNGYFGILQDVRFDIDYTVKNIEADFEVVALNNTAGIMLNWGNLKTTEGVVEGNAVSYTEHFPIQASTSIEIPDGTNVVFEGNANGRDLQIDENSYVVLSFQFDKSQNTTLFDMFGTDESADNISRKLEYVASDSILKYTVTKGSITATCEKQIDNMIGDICWYVVTLYPLIGGTIDFKVIESISGHLSDEDTGEWGLYPDDTLYPEDLFMYDEDGNVVDGEYNKATEIYDPNLTYYTLEDEELVEYTHDENTWGSDWTNLYCCLHPYFGKWNKLKN